MVDIRHNALPEDCCQLNERKDDGASENTIKHQIDEQTHVSASGSKAHHVQPEVRLGNEEDF